MTTYTVVCHSCGETWRLAGTWSAYESEATESRPCPHCDACTLSCPEPAAPAASRRRTPWAGRLTFATAGLLTRAA